MSEIPYSMRMMDIAVAINDTRLECDESGDWEPMAEVLNEQIQMSSSVDELVMILRLTRHLTHIPAIGAIVAEAHTKLKAAK